MSDEQLGQGEYLPGGSLCPVTRLERVGRISGLLLLAIGMIVLYLAADSRNNEPNLVVAAVASLLVGAGLTAFCFIYNAVRRW